MQETAIIVGNVLLMVRRVAVVRLTNVQVVQQVGIGNGRAKQGNDDGDKILDTHLGSGSIAIACHEMGFDLTGCELDKDYFTAMTKRLEPVLAQDRLFNVV